LGRRINIQTVYPNSTEKPVIATNKDLRLISIAPGVVCGIDGGAEGHGLRCIGL
jgi:hypothetical protein